jgi:23S rRNA (guanosine2251-2'-O)-methyltransferase
VKESKRERTIWGVQPVLEALRAGRPIAKIWVARSSRGATQRIHDAAEEAGVQVSSAEKDTLTARVGHDRHQGVIAELNEATGSREASVEDILEAAKERGEEPLVLLLDHLQDPQNVGAIVRSAFALGAHGVVIPKDRAAQVTAAVVRASAGAALHLPIARVTNIKHAIETLKEAGVWSAAAVLDGTPAHEARLDGPLALVIGSEGKGVAPSIAARCDLGVTIPCAVVQAAEAERARSEPKASGVKRFDSLNASVAAGILLYEAIRQRRAVRAAASSA